MNLKIKLIITIVFLSSQLYSQEWHASLPNNKDSKNLNFYQIQKAFNDHWKPLNVNKGKYLKDGKIHKVPNWKLYKRWEWYWESRIDKQTGEFPKTSTASEWEKYLSNNNQLKSTNGNWETLGPISSRGGYAGIGRINCISFHPTDLNKFWVGAPSGGLWATTDGGTNWTVLTDDNSVLGVSDIAIPSDFETSNTIYIATGDRDGGASWTLGGGNNGDNNSIGILKSTDAGQTWSNIFEANVGNGALMGFLRLHPTDDNTLYAGASNKVYKSTNGGANWNLSYNGSQYIIDLEFHPTNPETIYIATKSRNGDVMILKTIDGGTNWTEQHTFGNGDSRIELSVSAAAPDIVYAAVANTSGGLSGIYKSIDQGTSFTEIFSGDNEGNRLFGYYSDGSGDNTGQGNYDLAFTASPADANLLFLGGVNTWKSIDGGVNWTINNMWTSHSDYNKAEPKAPTVHADQHVLKFQNATNLFEGNDGGIYKTIDGGATWTDLTNGMTISQIYRLGAYAGSPDTVITGLQDNGSKLFYDGNWADVTGGDGMECLIDYTDSKIQYATYVDGQISRTKDLWNSSSDIYLNIGDGSLEGAWVAPYLIDPVDHKTLYVGYEEVWKSTDMGDTFTQISNIEASGNLRSMAIAPSNTQVLYVADQSHIWITKDGGTTWTDVTSILPVATNNITYLAVNAYDPEIAWVTFGGYSGGRIYQTNNGGQNWTNISGNLPSLPAFTVVQNKLAVSETHLYVGTDRGVYFKEADADWVLFSNGLPNVMVTELEIYYDEDTRENSRLLAATYGRGLWRSDLKAAPMIAVDAQLVSIENPVNQIYCGSQSITPQVIIKNLGTDNLTSATINFNIDDGELISQNWTGNLARSESVSVDLAGLLMSFGSYTFNASISNVNGGLDENLSNNTKSLSFEIADNNFDFPFVEGFNNELTPGCWMVETVNDVGSYNSPKISFVTTSMYPSASPSEGTHMVLFNSYFTDMGDQSRLISPALSSLNKTSMTVNFKWHEDSGYDTYPDSVRVQWSANGIDWNTVSSYARYNASNPGWLAKEIELPVEAMNQSTLYVAFLFISANGNDCLLDEVFITASTYQAITTGEISGGPFEISATSGVDINVPFNAVGAFSSNTFTAYLSDANGDFTNEVSIGTLVSDNNSGSIQAVIPANTPAGSSYKVRVKSSNPVIIGSQSNAFELSFASEAELNIGAITGSPFIVSEIQGTVIGVPYTVAGTFTENTFTAYLSDKNGDFTSEVQIGELESNTSGELLGIIPANTPSGEAYKVRMKSNNPAITSTESEVISVTLDNIRPTVVLSSAVENPTNVSPIEISILFSEPITGFDISKINVVNGTKNNLIIHGNSEFTFDLTPITDGEVSAEIIEDAVTDAIGNTNLASEKWSTNYIKALGIDDLSKEGIQVYPNPVGDNLNIKLAKSQKKVKLKLLGVDGRLYRSIEMLNAEHFDLDVSQLSKGLYIIQFNIDGRLLSVQILKQ